MKKQLTKQEYYSAIGLFMLANKAYRDGQYFSDALAKHLGYGADTYMGHISDVAFDSDPDFNEALKKEGFKLPRGMK